jgi:hypothetical protein
MSQSLLPKGQFSPNAKPGHMHKGAGKTRNRLAKMCFGVISVASLIAVIAVFATIFGTAPSAVVDTTASRAQPSTVATIIIHSRTTDCQQKSFSNETGQFSDRSSPCQSDVVVDAKGAPIPTGTIHTLNSISKSFKK